MKIVNNDNYNQMVVQKGKDLITFFTPTYNRSKFLLRIEDCLLQQTCKDFVWIIVNDGSKDNTEEIVENILNKEDLPLKYISKKNGGKHSAFKAAFEHCETTYFQCMDDDDIYYPDAVEFFLNKWRQIKEEGREDIGAIRTLAKYPNGSYSVNFPVNEGEEYDASTIETQFVMRRSQENWTCYDYSKLASVDLFKPYWLSDQHKFVTERIWQTRFARKFKCRYVNIALREYRDDNVVSLSHGIKSKQHYFDLFLNNKIMLDEQIDLIREYDNKSIMRRILIVNILRSYLGIPYEDLIKNTESNYLKKLYCITRIPSFWGGLTITLLK